MAAEARAKKQRKGAFDLGQINQDREARHPLDPPDSRVPGAESPDEPAPSGGEGHEIAPTVAEPDESHTADVTPDPQQVPPSAETSPKSTTRTTRGTRPAKKDVPAAVESTAHFSARIPKSLAKDVKLAAVRLDKSLQEVTHEALHEWLRKNE